MHSTFWINWIDGDTSESVREVDKKNAVSLAKIKKAEGKKVEIIEHAYEGACLLGHHVVPEREWTKDFLWEIEDGFAFVVIGKGSKTYKKRVWVKVKVINDTTALCSSVPSKGALIWQHLDLNLNVQSMSILGKIEVKIPKHEEWLYANEEAYNAVQKGLKQAENEGKE